MASHSSGKGAAWKRAECCRNHSDARSSPSAPSPSGRDIMEIGEDPEEEHRPERRRRRPADHPGDGEAEEEVGRDERAPGPERDQRRLDGDDPEADEDRLLEEGRHGTRGAHSAASALATAGASVAASGGSVGPISSTGPSISAREAARTTRTKSSRR